MHGISALYGIEPIIETFADPNREAVAVGEWLADCIAEGMPPDESGSSCATDTRRSVPEAPSRPPVPLPPFRAGVTDRMQIPAASRRRCHRCCHRPASNTVERSATGLSAARSEIGAGASTSGGAGNAAGNGNGIDAGSGGSGP
jgi:hypothetical protein